MLFELVFIYLIFIFDGAALAVFVRNCNQRNWGAVFFMTPAVLGCLGVSIKIFIEFLPVYLVIWAIIAGPWVGMMIFDHVSGKGSV